MEILPLLSNLFKIKYKVCLLYTQNGPLTVLRILVNNLLSLC